MLADSTTIDALTLPLWAWLDRYPFLLLLWVSIRVALCHSILLLCTMGLIRYLPSAHSGQRALYRRQLSGEFALAIAIVYSAVACLIAAALFVRLDFNLHPDERATLLLASGYGYFTAVAELTDLGVVALSIFCFYRMPRELRPSLFSLPDRARLLIVCGVVVVTLAIFVLLHHLRVLGAAPTGSAIPSSLIAMQVDSRSFWGWAAWVLFVVPVAEETLFRGVLFPMLRLTAPPSIALVLQAVIFALMHLSGGRIAELVAIGLILGWTVMWTRSLSVAILTHLALSAIPILSHL